MCQWYWLGQWVPPLNERSACGYDGCSFSTVFDALMRSFFEISLFRFCLQWSHDCPAKPSWDSASRRWGCSTSVFRSYSAKRDSHAICICSILEPADLAPSLVLQRHLNKMFARLTVVQPWVLHFQQQQIRKMALLYHWIYYATKKSCQSTMLFVVEW